jgi:hypothetical protein
VTVLKVMFGYGDFSEEQEWVKINIDRKRWIVAH